MPRLSPAVLRYAASRSAHLPRLLRECRDLDSATNELRWLAEYANSKSHNTSRKSANIRLMQYVRRRARGEPLQYILGTQPFGELDLLCRKGVLIPRPETELYTTTLAELLINLQSKGVIDQRQQPVRIADLCTGTGCIALLLHTLWRSDNTNKGLFQDLEILGVDVSPHALKLAGENLNRNLSGGVLDASCTADISFKFLDVLRAGEDAKQAMDFIGDAHIELDLRTSHFLNSRWDVIVSNPPYISQSDYAPGGTVSSSVRDYEPKMALVPPKITLNGQRTTNQADQFYDAILHVACKVKAKLLVMEIGDSQQAYRVRRLAVEIMSTEVLIETWSDDGSVIRYGSARDLGCSLDAVDSAPERAIVVWTGSWADWRSKEMARDR